MESVLILNFANKNIRGLSFFFILMLVYYMEN